MALDEGQRMKGRVDDKERKDKGQRTKDISSANGFWSEDICVKQIFVGQDWGLVFPSLGSIALYTIVSNTITYKYSNTTAMTYYTTTGSVIDQ